MTSEYRMNFASSLLLILALLLAAAPPAVNAQPLHPLITGVRSDGEGGAESKGFAKTLRLTTDVDLVNERVCRIGATYFFSLAQAAKVTLKATPLNSASVPTGTPQVLIDAKDYDIGEHPFSLDPAQFLPRQDGYLLELKAVATADPTQIESVESKLLVTYDLKDALPVGQVLVKGVNVKSGRLVLPAQSIQVSGRGPQLAFKPVYSSGGNGKIGPLGANWSNNFEAGIAITPCGDVIVSTGDAGSMRFLPGPNNTLIPGKGYHGTLIANSIDKSFDFFSKDGTQRNSGS